MGRIRFIDTAKGIAIILIVAGHVGFSSILGVNWVGRFVFEFHVPIFFIISGYFLSTTQPFMQYCTRRTKRLLLPYLFTCCLMLMLLIILFGILGRTSPPAIFNSFKEFFIAALYGAGTPGVKLPAGVTHIGAIWFLEALLIALIEVRLCLKMNRAASLIIVLLAALAVGTARHIWLPLNIQAGLTGGLYVYVGYLLRGQDLFHEEQPFPTLMFLALTTIVIVAFYAEINVSLARAYLGKYCLGFPVSVAGSIWCIFLAKLIREKTTMLNAFFEFFGKNSLAVLCIHLILLDIGFKRLLLLADIPPGNTMSIVNMILQLAIAASGAVMLKRIPGIRNIFS